MNEELPSPANTNISESPAENKPQENADRQTNGEKGGVLGHVLFYFFITAGPILQIELVKWSTEPPKNIYAVSSILLAAALAGCSGIKAYFSQHAAKLKLGGNGNGNGNGNGHKTA